VSAASLQVIRFWRRETDVCDLQVALRRPVAGFYEVGDALRAIGVEYFRPRCACGAFPGHVACSTLTEVSK